MSESYRNYPRVREISFYFETTIAWNSLFSLFIRAKKNFWSIRVTTKTIDSMTIHPLYRYWNLYAGMQKKHEIFKVCVTFVRIVFRITMKLNNSFVHASHIFFFFHLMIIKHIYHYVTMQSKLNNSFVRHRLSRYNKIPLSLIL